MSEKMLAFSVPYEVLPKQGDRSRIATNKSGKQFVAHYPANTVTRNQKELAALIAPYRPKEPFDEPMFLQVIFIYPYLPSHSAKKRRELVYFPKDTKPDCDNLTKQILDVLERSGFVANDSRIGMQWAIKVYGPQAEVLIHLRPASQPAIRATIDNERRAIERTKDVNSWPA